MRGQTDGNSQRESPLWIKYFARAELFIAHYNRPVEFGCNSLLKAFMISFKSQQEL